MKRWTAEGIRKKMGNLRRSYRRLPKARRRLIAGGVIVLAAGTVGGSVFVLTQRERTAFRADTMDTAQAVASAGDISNTIVGTGNLELGDSQAVTIPSGVVVDQVLVESGDSVAQGDTLATVDTASVVSAMAQVQEEITALDEEISENQEEAEDSQEVTAGVSGRVKRIYGQEGSDVLDIMAENGAVMLLSLDGKMAVDLEGSFSLAVQDTVTVLLADGSQEEGTVETVSDDFCTITLTDAGVGLEETVTVENEEGETLGTGSTYIYRQMEVTAAGGTVEEISVSEDEAVEAGDTLFTLEGGEASSAYQELLLRRETLAKELQELSALAKSGVISATQDGIVDTVNVTGSTSAGTGSDSQEMQISSMAYTAEGAGEADSGTDSSTQTGTEAVFLQLSSKENSPAEDTEDDSQGQLLQLQVASQGTAGSSVMVLAAPRTGALPQTTVAAGDGSWEGTVSWDPADDSFAPGTVYQAQVMLVAGEGWYFSTDSILGTDTGVISGITLSQDGSTLQFSITYPETEEDATDEGTGEPEDQDGSEGDGEGAGDDKTDSDGQTSDSDGMDDKGQTTSDDGTGEDSQTGGSGEAEEDSQTGESGEAEEDTQTGDSEKTTENSQTGGDGQGLPASLSAVPSGSASGQQSGGGAGSLTGSSQNSSSATLQNTAASEETESGSSVSSSEDSDEVTAFTIATSESMVLTVSVDELDINSVALDQTAEITLDAIEGETFEGQVTRINNVASASGGVAKYSVEVTLDRAEQMKAGMNASATIVVEEREDVVTIPVSALQERGSQVFVYTGLDEDGNPTDEQEVTTGLSDGENVEITEGLSEGDTVYYQASQGSAGGTSGSGEVSGEGGMPDMGSFGEGGMPDMGSFGGDGMPDMESFQDGMGGQTGTPPQEGR